MKLLSFALTLAFASLAAAAPAKKETVKEYLRLTNTREMSNQVVQQMRQTMLKAQEQAADLSGNPKGSGKAKAMMKELDAVMDDFQKKEFSFDILEPEITKILQDTWTDEELKRLNDFYASPVGRKMVRETPALMMKMNAVVQGRLEKSLPGLRAKMDRIFDRYMEEARKAQSK